MIDVPENTINPSKSPPCLFTIAPAMGLPTKAPTALNAYSVPILAPILRMSEVMLATIAGIMEKVHPEVKPYNAAYAMSGALVCAGNQTAKVKMEPKRVVMIITLNTPYLSPR